MGIGVRARQSVLRLAGHYEGYNRSGSGLSTFGGFLGWLVKYEPVYVIPLGFPPFAAPFLPREIVWGSLAVFLLPWVLRLVRYRHTLVRTPLDAPLAVFLVGAAIGLYPSVDLRLSMERLYGIVAGVAVYYMIVNNRGRSYLKAYVLVLFAASTAFALWGLRHVPLAYVAERSRLAWVLEGLQSLWPASFSFELHAVVAGVLVVSIPLAGALALVPQLESRRKPPVAGPLGLLQLIARLRGFRACCFVVLPVMLVILALISNRAGLIALLASLAVGAIAYDRRLALVAPFFAAAGFWMFMKFVGLAEGLLDTANGVSRLAIWESAYYMLQDFAYTGVGLSAFPYVYPFYRLPSANEGWMPNVHNLYLQVYLDQGLLGFSSWIIVMGIIAVGLVRLIRRARRGTIEFALGVGLAGSFVALAVHGVFDTSLMGGPFHDSAGVLRATTSPLPFVLAGLLFGAAHVTNQGCNHFL